MLAVGAAGPRGKSQRGSAASSTGRFDAYPDLMTVQHMQEITGLSAQTIRAECSKGGIPAVRIGRRWFVPKMRLIDCLSENRGSYE